MKQAELPSIPAAQADWPGGTYTREGGLPPAPYAAQRALAQRVGWAPGSILLPPPPGRNRVLEEDELFPPKSMVPLAAGLGHPLLSATPCSEVPQADSPLPSPHPPACPPGPSEFRHPSLQLKLHSGPGAEPVSVALSLEGSVAGGWARHGLDLVGGETGARPGQGTWL